jgi:hypothetical protein
MIYIGSSILNPVIGFPFSGVSKYHTLDQVDVTAALSSTYPIPNSEIQSPPKRESTVKVPSFLEALLFVLFLPFVLMVMMLS